VAWAVYFPSRIGCGQFGLAGRQLVLKRLDRGRAFTINLRVGKAFAQARGLNLQRLDARGERGQFALFVEVEPLRVRPHRSRRDRRPGGRRRALRARVLLCVASRVIVHPVAEAARVFAQVAVALESDRLRDDIVQERAVVAHHEQRAGEVLQQRLQ